MAGLKEQNFDYFLVLDFEATCDKNDKPVPQEIIEFPVLKVNGKTFTIDDRFHQYVQPEVHKELTQFCTELTGIIQDQVDGRPHIKETLQSFHEWMKSQNLLNPNVSSVFVTCGDWDLKTMLPHQCKYFNIDIPDYFKKWINIKKPFCDVTGTYTKGMMPMLDMLNIHHEGRLHSGIDDCLNIARILKAIAEKGYVFKVTESGPDMGDREKCFKCGRSGHFANECSRGSRGRGARGGGRSGGEGACYNCGRAGHVSRDCTEQRRSDDSDSRFNCRGAGNRHRNSPKERSERRGGGGDGGSCYNCGEMGHMARDCPDSGRRSGGRGGGGGSCFKCGDPGHFSRECPKSEGASSVRCYNCNEMGHFAYNCTAKE